jgi:hypothetical protein
MRWTVVEAETIDTGAVGVGNTAADIGGSTAALSGGDVGLASTRSAGALLVAEAVVSGAEPMTL